MQYLTQAAIKLLSAGDDARSGAQLMTVASTCSINKNALGTMLSILAPKGQKLLPNDNDMQL